MIRSPLDDELHDLIRYLFEAGHGYAKFASNVQAQGWVSPKQEETMRRMRREIESRRALYYARRSSRAPSNPYYLNGGEPDISDCEAMQSGDFF